jgi:hypothetical protein
VARIATEYTQLTYLVDQARKEECDYVGAIEDVSRRASPWRR